MDDCSGFEDVDLGNESKSNFDVAGEIDYPIYEELEAPQEIPILEEQGLEIKDMNPDQNASEQNSSNLEKPEILQETPIFEEHDLETETRYLLNDPVQWGNLGYDHANQNFNNHWMSITKYFKNGVTGDTFVAFSSWSKRFSINVDLLKTADKTKYYSDFYGYKLLSK